jgi:MFS family permease
MFDTLRSNPRVGGLAALYAGTFLSGAWAIIIPTIPVLARQFGVSAGGAAQIVTAFAVGKFVGTVIAGIVLDRMGTRIALVGGPMGAMQLAFLVAVAGLAQGLSLGSLQPMTSCPPTCGGACKQCVARWPNWGVAWPLCSAAISPIHSTRACLSCSTRPCWQCQRPCWRWWVRRRWSGSASVVFILPPSSSWAPLA